MKAAGSPGPRRSWALLAFVVLGASLLRAGACGDPIDPPGPLDGFDVSGLLTGIGADIVLVGYTDFGTAATSLAGATDSWSTALQSGDGAVELDLARAAWRNTMSAWQRAETILVGPAGASVATTILPATHAGEDLRDEIYSWPTVNPCRVDQEVLEEGYVSGSFFADNLVNAYGLDALEYLLFAPDADTVCPSQVIEPADWDALGDDEVGRRRAEYGSVLAAELVVQADALLAWWDLDGIDGTPLAFPGSVGWLDEEAALQSVFESLFYVELVVKDRKLARPVGLLDCASDTCPEDFESAYAAYSLHEVAANLATFRTVVEGPDDGLGLVHVLEHVDSAQVGVDLLAAVDAAIAANAELLGSDPVDVLASSPDDLQAVHDALKMATDLMKGEVALVLALRVPTESAGDND